MAYISLYVIPFLSALLSSPFPPHLPFHLPQSTMCAFLPPRSPQIPLSTASSRSSIFLILCSMYLPLYTCTTLYTVICVLYILMFLSISVSLSLCSSTRYRSISFYPYCLSSPPSISLSPYHSIPFTIDLIVLLLFFSLSLHLAHVISYFIMHFINMTATMTGSYIILCWL